MSINISAIILTFNSQETLRATLDKALQVCQDVHIVDSFSTDDTLRIAKDHGVNIVQRPFENYGAQRNWAIENLPIKGDWELHLDADERLSEELVSELNALDNDSTKGIDGFYLSRLVHFMGKPIRHGGMFPIWHMRLFRRGKGKCESRLYDQHFYVKGKTSQLRSPFIDDIKLPLIEWTVRHNRWAELEVAELTNRSENREIRGELSKNPVERKRFYRNLYHRFPLLVRPFLLFVYRYFIRLGFLDGKEGLVFFALQTFWYRFLIDAKLLEHRLKSLNQPKKP